METVRRDPRGQGDSEQLAAVWFASQGAAVFMPFFHSPRDYDFIVDMGQGVKRVLVKTSTYFQTAAGA